MSSKPKKPRGRPKKKSMAGTASMTNPGRPVKTDLTNLSYSTLNRRLHDLAEKFDHEALERAVSISKRKRNYVEVESTENTHSQVNVHKLETAFAFFMDHDYSKITWDALVEDTTQHGAPIYPSYYKLSKVKKECRPSVYTEETETCVQVPFQIMLNKSAERLVTAVGIDWLPEDLNNLVLICAYGFDSSSGFINPHQKFEDPENETLTTSELSLFASTFILCGLKTETGKNMWMNPTPQSVRFCRPLRIAIEKEDEYSIRAEDSRLRKEISNLRPYTFSLPNGKRASVRFDLYLSMIDGKCLNAVLGNSATTRCPVCYVLMNRFNEDEDWNSTVPPGNLLHGIANLHCEIKTLELLLKLSSRRTFKEWRIEKDMKRAFKKKFAAVKKKLWHAFSIRVGEVKHGSGTSLNGNTARTCFKDPLKVANVLGINADLVKRLSYIVLAFKQKQGLNLETLGKYCTETYKLFFKLYPWAKMNPSVHKMLRHGADIARNFPFSLAYFAEDSAESMHKYYRKNSVHHARQNSRANRLKDVFNRAVDMSDPLISMVNLEKRCKFHKEELPSEFVTIFGINDEF
ncbi:hypothetical protein Bhyg_01384 [Pseudolycoriella hygida]|uniref:Uncharacterized protein n=1 Tax=Pseudolycoriella hygida TaxID=35572 RepID=A0A9Q0N9F1_9DIPT|nr:hypothetical protein Bhyg_01384 [Pseudolycoriella hygida]